MFGDEAGGYIFRLESKLAEAESQLASSRTERDRAYAEIEELRFSYKNKSDQIAAARTESTQLRVERDQALEALQNLVGLFRHPSPFYIKKLGGPITNGDQAEIDAAFQKADSLARPIPAEKPDREG
jgi:chromosome segregation ATPase